MNEDIGNALSGMNPLQGVKMGSMTTMASMGILIVIVIFILILITILIWMYAVNRQYWLKIHIFRLVGNNPTRVAIYVAKEVNFGLAGDKLWRVAPSSKISMAFKIIKWLPVGKLQTAPREFWYWIRNDGEWINFNPENIDEIQKTMKVKFVQEDMRLQRLATEKILEQRLLNKNFWDKYGTIIGYVIFFLVITVAVIIIFYQWSKLIDKMGPLVDRLTEALVKTQASCGGNSLIPVTP